MRSKTSCARSDFNVKATRALLASAAAAGALVLTACTGGGEPSPTTPGETAIEVTDSAVADSIVGPDAVATSVAGLPQRTIAPLPTTHVADGVSPPTNRWYSSLAFGDELLPVFASPLSFRLTDGGFTYGLPRVDATENTIFGSARDDVTVTLDSSPDRPVVSAAGPVAIELRYGSADSPLGTINLAAGWPVVALSASADLDATLSIAFTATGEGLATATVDGVEYAVLVDGGQVDGTTLSLDADGSAQFFAVPNGGSAQSFTDALGSPVTSVATSFTASVGGDVESTTTLSYLSGKNGDSATVTAVPQERDASAECSLGTYDTIDGTLAVCASAQAEWSVPGIAPATALDLSDVTDDQRDAIAIAVSDAVADPMELPADTYFGTKALYRLANLMQIATAIGSTDDAEQLRWQLVKALKTWTEPTGCEDRDERCFVYDPQWNGVVGQATAFGSEEFNDHHFHYGYLLYAAAVAGADDPELVADMAPVMDAVAADIGAFAGSPAVPQWRVFDPYAGHSWASGTSPFGDGNNQESSSEAVAAWTGLAAWAEVREDAALATSATWMLSAESEAANRLWLRPDLTGFDAFEHSIVALQWGGKRDYTTWFSPEPNAMLGIQLIPAAPSAMVSLRPSGEADVTAIRDSVAEAAPGGYDVQFGDYMLMYLALAGADDAAQAWDEAVALPADSIDDANSRAYMLAWIASSAA